MPSRPPIPSRSSAGPLQLHAAVGLQPSRRRPLPGALPAPARTAAARPRAPLPHRPRASCEKAPYRQRSHTYRHTPQPTTRRTRRPSTTSRRPARPSPGGRPTPADNSLTPDPTPPPPYPPRPAPPRPPQPGTTLPPPPAAAPCARTPASQRPKPAPRTECHICSPQIR